ncbi:MAG: response regulator [Elusimicrobiota bacterium]
MPVKQKILVIDDDEHIIKLLAVVLGNSGYEIAVAAGPAEGLGLAFKNKFDLIILDLLMKPIDGLDVLTQLRKDNSTKSVPVLMLTVADQIKDIDAAQNSGATAYMAKPINVARLQAKVAQLLDVSAPGQ